MKKLCLIRHAKSNWDHAADDHDRPLDERGQHDAQMLGKFLRDKGIKPDVLLASAAARAVETAQIIAQALDFSADKIISEESIYEAGVEDLLAIIQKLNPKHNTAMLVGHNPGLTWLANYLAEDHIANLHTCGTYFVEFDTNDWSDITTVEGSTAFIENPTHAHE